MSKRKRVTVEDAPLSAKPVGKGFTPVCRDCLVKPESLESDETTLFLIKCPAEYDIKPAKDAEVQQIRVFLPVAPQDESDSATNTSDDEDAPKPQRNLRAVRKPISSAFHVVSGFTQSLLPESAMADERIQPVALGYRAPVEQTKTATYKLRPIGFGSVGPSDPEIRRVDADDTNGKREHKKKKEKSRG